MNKSARNVKASRGFSLIEIAIVLVIITVLVTIVAVPLATQVEQQRISETNKQLEIIKEAIIGFAIANGRFPCAARVSDNGVESLTSPAATPPDGACGAYIGLLPAVTLGISPQDQNGFALDGWGLPQNRIRYAVSDIPATSTAAVGCPAVAVNHPFTKVNGMKEAGMTCLANYNSDTSAPAKTLLTVCPSTPASAQPYCAARKLTISAPFVVISLGKNAPVGGLATTDEGFNAGTRGNNTVFVSHSPTPEGAPGGEFDDIVVWPSLNTIFGRMVQAGKLP